LKHEDIMHGKDVIKIQLVKIHDDNMSIFRLK